MAKSLGLSNCCVVTQRDKSLDLHTVNRKSLVRQLLERQSRTYCSPFLPLRGVQRCTNFQLSISWLQESCTSYWFSRNSFWLCLVQTVLYLAVERAGDIKELVYLSCHQWKIKRMQNGDQSSLVKYWRTGSQTRTSNSGLPLETFTCAKNTSLKSVLKHVSMNLK